MRGLPSFLLSCVPLLHEVGRFPTIYWNLTIAMCTLSVEMPLVVDNSAGMVQEAIRKGLKGINLDAESFSKLPDQCYNKVPKVSLFDRADA